MKKFFVLLISILAFAFASLAQESLIGAISGRKTTSLNGTWQYIIDPYETGFYDYRYKELNENSGGAYWSKDSLRNKTNLKEFGFTNKRTLKVPGDWNHQDRIFEYYEGTVWYSRKFDFTAGNPANDVHVYFGAVNYKADVYLNGKKLGTHEGGFTPFNFKIPRGSLKPADNWLVVKVDNKRHKDDVPTLNTDWWNYGGITRDVNLVELPQTFIENFTIQLKKEKRPSGSSTKKANLTGFVKLNSAANEKVFIEIPELKIKKELKSNGSIVNFSFPVSNLQLWSTENPKLYNVILRSGRDIVTDKIGFRTVEATETQLLLNGKPVFMRGICIHAEIPQEIRRAHSKEDALQLLQQAKELGCNMVRLAHYPHDEYVVRIADSLGVLVWSEIPVYWTIDFTSREVYQKAEKQLEEMITRDQNRASVIIWSVGNETPVSETRTNFMRSLINTARRLDSTRLVSAALEVHYGPGRNENVIDDPLGQYVDIVAFNEYLGWYGGLPNDSRNASWSTPYKKPLLISETGAGAKGGFHADSLTRFSEEYQEWYYKEQINMFRKMPGNWVGVTPWVLNDFRSPKRNNPYYQEGWNRKGLYDNNLNRKKAFYVLKEFYREMADKNK